MRRLVGVLAMVTLLVSAGAVHLANEGQSNAPAWNDEGPSGHSELLALLGTQQQVRAIAGSLTLIPPDAGPGDVLMLFGGATAPSQEELHRVAVFVAAGGRLVIAADGTSSDAWFDHLGVVRPHGIPVRLTGAPAECVPVQTSVGNMCLPSPSAFAEDHLGLSGPSFVHRSQRDVFLDLDADGELGLGDQGPGAFPLVAGWTRGAGDITAVADADLWRNEVVRRDPTNLDAALRLAAEAETVYVDSTGNLPPGASATLARKALATAHPIQLLLATAFVAAVLAGAALAPRARPWDIHHCDDLVEDKDVEAYLHGLATKRSTTEN